MFFHIYKYRLKALFHQKEEFFWNLIFPLILATCFFAAFSKITESTEGFSTIPVAVVLEETDGEKYFTEMMDALSESKDGEEAFFAVNYVAKEAAEALLEDKEVAGMIVLKEAKPSLIILENGMEQTMIKAVMDKYLQTMDVITGMIPDHMDRLEQVMEAVSDEVSYIREQKLTDGNIDNIIDYFFALIAMTCLMGTSTGQVCITYIKANLSAIGLRKSISSAKRMTMILGDMAATYSLSALSNAVLLIYLKYILKLNMGGSFLEIYAVTLVGSLIGISIGILIGSLPGVGEGAKMGINLCITLFSSFLSGLMMGGIKYLIEEHCPIINRINPASLISDALHSLNIYDDYAKYAQCMVIMVVMSVVLLTAGIVIARRETYDNI